jgi:ribulose-phosphate 3-epimerase
MLLHISRKGVKAGLAINPDIPVESLFPYLAQCDYVLLMSVFAGFGGQKFIEETYERVAAVRKEIVAQGLDCKIQVDGGVSAANSKMLIECGAEILVAGSAVFKAEDPQAVISEMKKA